MIKKVYISQYEEYPIYEAAEGGYYYSGNNLVGSKKISQFKAKEELEEIWKEADEENVQLYGMTLDEICKNDFRDKNGRKIRYNYWVKGKGFIRWVSEYIGDGRSYVIETHRGSDIRGWEPYC